MELVGTLLNTSLTHPLCHQYILYTPLRTPVVCSNLYINLSSKLERSLMELLARETLAKGSVDMISKIFDQNLEFVSLEQRLFSLDRPGSFVQYNDPTCPGPEVSIDSPMTGLLKARR